MSSVNLALSIALVRSSTSPPPHPFLPSLSSPFLSDRSLLLTGKWGEQDAIIRVTLYVKPDRRVVGQESEVVDLCLLKRLCIPVLPAPSTTLIYLHSGGRCQIYKESP